MALLYGYWWAIAVPALILFYAYTRKHVPIYLFLGVSLICQFLSFLTMTGIARTMFWLRNPYNFFWGETLAMAFILVGASSLYGKIGTFFGSIFGVVYTVLWFLDPSGWFSRYEIVSAAILVLSAVGIYNSYRRKDGLLYFLILFTIGSLLTLVLYPLAFMRSLFPQEALRAMFIVIPLVLSFLAVLNAKKPRANQRF